MKVRFLVDKDLPRSLSLLLRSRGYESAHVIDLGLRGASDAVIFRIAQECGCILISRDLGFANTLHYPIGSHHGVVVVRFPSKIRSQLLVRQTDELLQAIGESEFDGALLILEPGRVRIRRSP